MENRVVEWNLYPCLLAGSHTPGYGLLRLKIGPLCVIFWTHGSTKLKGWSVASHDMEKGQVPNGESSPFTTLRPIRPQDCPAGWFVARVSFFSLSRSSEDVYKTAFLYRPFLFLYSPLLLSFLVIWLHGLF